MISTIITIMIVLLPPLRKQPLLPALELDWRCKKKKQMAIVLELVTEELLQ
jgi:hypothetical protein